MAKRKTNEKSNSSVVDVPVEFGGVSIGDNSARLGIRMDRSVMNVVAADEVFCGHRLNGELVLGGHDDNAGQGKLLDDMDETLRGTFDVKRIGVNAKSISTGLTFSLADIDIGLLAKFSKGSGRLIVHGMSELPVEEEDLPDELRQPILAAPVGAAAAMGDEFDDDDDDDDQFGGDHDE